MDPQRLRALLEDVQAGRATVDDSMAALRDLPFRALDFAHVDTHRHLRTGFPEVVLGTGKTPEQIAAILKELAAGGAAVFATRVSPEAAAAVVADVPGARYLAGAPNRRRGREPAGRQGARAHRRAQRRDVGRPRRRGGGRHGRAVGQPRRADLRRRGGGLASPAGAPGDGRRRRDRHRRRRHGRGAAQRGRRPVRAAGHRRADQRRVRRQPGWHRRAAGDAELLRVGRGRR